MKIFGCEAYALIPKDDRQKLEPRSMELYLSWLWTCGKIRYRLSNPEHKQIVQSSDVVFNESTMQKTAERPIEVRRVIFSELPTLHENPTQYTRSTSRVTETSSTKSVDSAQSNALAPDHLTKTPYQASPVIPRRFERLIQPPRGTLL